MSVIEQVLRRAYSGRHSPYRWLARAVSTRAVDVLDVGSGAALAEELSSHGRTHRVVQLDDAQQALALPYADASFDVVTSATGVTVIEDLDLFLAEVRRVLRPGGMAALMTAGIYPMTAREAWLHLQLAVRLRATPRLAGPRDLADLALSLRAAGLRVVEDRRERYRIDVADRTTALLVVQALCARGADPARIEATADWLAMRAAAQPVPVALPIRRVVAVKN